MEQNSPADSKLEAQRILEGQIRNCFGRVVYSHKTHEKCGDILLSQLSTIKKWQIILSAITAVGFITIIFGSGTIGASIGATVAVVLLALNTYVKDHDLGELAGKHKAAGNELWLIREKYLSLLTDLAIGEKTMTSLQQERDTLAFELHQVYAGSPSTTYRAYQKAQESLKQLEEMTFSENEIDAFLPDELRRGTSKAIAIPE
ncbi:SLATT domain-containing protein [Dehalogenimonas etheniformans]|uniref:SMODS and SLOG-associating 2TM effector domain-containing protein n=1 Tax=Dehalogenimonas etheniformans TaxID=1536648 RepID=A0A2P5P8P1_9CHLR|nr:SLATT domain-containing protein [Dehalogenimonas etheniformans]PPD58672.1 hypothetical protein JP09_002005 [Dehalogenimonas etheniformans]